MNYEHCRGSLDNVGGQLLAIGGANIGFQGLRYMEIYDGRTWNTLPNISEHRRSFSTVVINSTSLVLIGGINTSSAHFDGACSDFLMYHIDTMEWIQLPDYPHRQADLACCNFDYGVVQGIFCIGGDGPPGFRSPSHHAIIFNWANFTWNRAPKYDLFSDTYRLGSVTQFKNWLYYIPYYNHVDKKN